MRPRIARHRTGRQTASPGSACGVGPNFRLALAAALVLAAALGRDVPCRAGLLIEAPSLLATPGSSNSFDLLLVNTNPASGASYNVAADSFELSLSGPVGVTFTDVSINTIVALHLRHVGDHRPGGRAALAGYVPEHAVHGLRRRVWPPGFPDGESWRHARPGPRLLHSQPDGYVGCGHDRDCQWHGHIAVGCEWQCHPVRDFERLDRRAGPAGPRALCVAQAATAAMIGLGYWWRRRGKGAIS